MSYQLPTAPRGGNNTLEGMSFCIYGRPGIGKSTLASTFPSPIFISTEPGLRELEVFDAPVKSWGEFLDVCKALMKRDSHQFQTIVVDTIDNLALLCQEQICKEQQISHPADLAYGKGYSLVSGEFHRVLQKLVQLGFTVVFVGHAKEEQVEVRNRTFTTYRLDMSKGMSKVVNALVDFLLFYDVEIVGTGGEQVNQRVLRTIPTETSDAKNRGGHLPPSIPMPNGSGYSLIEEAYKAGKEGRGPTTNDAGAEAFSGRQESPTGGASFDPGSRGRPQGRPQGRGGNQGRGGAQGRGRQVQGRR